ncbi:MAG: hAT transposon family protein, partial [Candidatus Thiodiazotropha sp.]
DILLNPNRYPCAANDIQVYGQDQLRTLGEHYQVIDRNRAQAVFLVFKHLARSYKGSLSFAKFCCKLINEFSDQYPDFAMLARLALVIPVSSAPCERGFSVQNALKTKVRNRLNPERLNRLMFIKLIGPDIDRFDFPIAARLFANMKPRMK